MSYNNPFNVLENNENNENILETFKNNISLVKCMSN